MTSDPSKYFLGVDGGGSKTSCYLGCMGPDGRPQVLGRGIASGSNPRTAGMDQAVTSILRSVEQAKADAAISDAVCLRGLFAIAGTLDLEIRRELAERLSLAAVAQQCDVVPDLLPLLETNVDNRIAIGLIAGTGSVGIGRNSDGQIAIAGGWGPLVGDDGSGFAIGRAALRHSLMLLESGRAQDRLTQAICEQLKSAAAADIRAQLALAVDQRSEVARLAKNVMEVAMSGDVTAAAMIARAARDLVDLVQQLRMRLRLSADSLPITLSGGLFQAGDYFRSHVEQALAAEGIAFEIHQLHDPTLACLAMAVRGTCGELQLLR